MELTHLPLTYTLYVPHELKMNLLSIQSMSRNLECKFILDGKNFTIKDNKTGCVILNGSGSLSLNHKNPNSNHHIATNAKNSCVLQTWHRRCEHPSSTILAKIIKNYNISFFNDKNEYMFGLSFKKIKEVTI